jgi:hypothetical protein
MMKKKLKWLINTLFYGDAVRYGWFPTAAALVVGGESSKCLALRWQSPPLVTENVDPTTDFQNLAKKELTHDINSEFSYFQC